MDAKNGQQNDSFIYLLRVSRNQLPPELLLIKKRFEEISEKIREVFKTHGNSVVEYSGLKFKGESIGDDFIVSCYVPLMPTLSPLEDYLTNLERVTGTILNPADLTLPMPPFHQSGGHYLLPLSPFFVTFIEDNGKVGNDVKELNLELNVLRPMKKDDVNIYRNTTPVQIATITYVKTEQKYLI